VRRKTGDIICGCCGNADTTLQMYRKRMVVYLRFTNIVEKLVRLWSWNEIFNLCTLVV